MEKIWEALNEGAPFSFINIAVLALALAIIAERVQYILSKYRVNASEFMAQIRKLVQAGNIDRAIKLCEAAPLPLLQVIKAGLSEAKRGEDVIVASMEERMAEVLPELEKRIASLWSLANIATLIGLLGTISGLIRAFAAVGMVSDPSQKTAMLSRGISEAMWNTALGLGIAVVCMAAHLVIHGMAKRNKMELERASMNLENLLTLSQKS